MTIYGLIGIALILAASAMTLGVILHDLMKTPNPEPDDVETDTWRLMLVTHGNLHESEDRL